MAAIQSQEFVRFFVAGVVATASNILAVWVARAFTSYEFALLFGIAAGITVSFILSKFLAFRSRDWSAAGGEARRFAAVYVLGVSLYWIVASVAGRALSAGTLPVPVAEMAGVLIGAGLMTITSYFGHRFFTFRTHVRR